MADPESEIERELTLLLRRVQSIHLSTRSGSYDLDRSAYGILCRIADEGPQRMGALATQFGLDPSTITRQVKALEHLDLIDRRADPDDKRAVILGLTAEGSSILASTRAHRRQRLEATLAGWNTADVAEFGRLLAKFNVAIDGLAADPSR